MSRRLKLLIAGYGSRVCHRMWKPSFIGAGEVDGRLWLKEAVQFRQKLTSSVQSASRCWVLVQERCELEPSRLAVVQSNVVQLSVDWISQVRNGYLQVFFVFEWKFGDAGESATTCSQDRSLVRPFAEKSPQAYEAWGDSAEFLLPVCLQVLTHWHTDTSLLRIL